MYTRKEHPIVMSQKSVQDILAGRKKQTRRVYKSSTIGRHVGWTTTGEIVLEISTDGGTGRKHLYAPCPYGNLHDLLWVREAWTRPDGTKGSARYMPKAKARLWLVITNITIEPLGIMSESDARSEGYANLEEYKGAWNALNAKRGYPWRDDQYVWVIKFKIWNKKEA